MPSTDVFRKGDAVAFDPEAIKGTDYQQFEAKTGLVAETYTDGLGGSLVVVDFPNGNRTVAYAWRFNPVKGHPEPQPIDLDSDTTYEYPNVPAEYDDPFEDIALELVEVHDRKGKDYGAVGDPYRNVRMSEEFGLPAWIGVGVRMNDKMKRLQTASQQYLESGEVRLKHEGLIDIANDFAVYGIILRIMIEEWLEAGHEDLSEGRL